VSWRSPSLSDVEREAVQAFGARLRERRESVGMSRERLARDSEISLVHLRTLERGACRTRLSTVQRIAAALTPDGGEVERAGLVDEFVGLLDCALAAESVIADRQARGRARRRRRTEAHQRRVDEWWVQERQIRRLERELERLDRERPVTPEADRHRLLIVPTGVVRDYAPVAAFVGACSCGRWQSPTVTEKSMTAAHFALHMNDVTRAADNR
jgi:transcriptional regulator with XRE-family HTH domain